MSRLHKVDPTTIQSTKDFEIIGRNEKHLPSSVRRYRDNTVWSIRDFVTNGTKMRGYITGFEFFISEDDSSLTCYITHTWSGVGMGLEDLQIANDLPAEYQINQVAKFVLNKTEHTCTVRNVHFLTSGKVTYDVDVWLGDDGNSSTRLYNVDSQLVKEQ